MANISRLTRASSVPCILVAVLWRLVHNQASFNSAIPFFHGTLFYSNIALASNMSISEVQKGYPISEALESRMMPGRTFSFLSLFGFTFLPSRLKALDLDLSRFFKSSAERFCERMLEYTWLHPADGGFSYPTVYANWTGVKLFRDACLKEYNLLSSEEQHILGPYLEKGSIPEDVLMPPMGNVQAIKEQAPKPAPATEEQLPREEVIEIKTRFDKVGFPWGKPEDINVTLDFFRQLDPRKVKAAPSSWGELGQFLRDGEIVKFNAKTLFPTNIFHMTPAAIAMVEGNAAHRIVTHSDGAYPTTLADYGKLIAGMKQRAEYNEFHNTKVATQTHVNTKRTPKFHSKLPDVAEELGIANETLRSESFLWMGARGPGMMKASWGFKLKYDEEAQIYIQINGETDVYMVPQNYTDKAFGAARFVDYPHVAWLRDNPQAGEEFRTAPLLVVHLSPGDGLVLPSRTYHSFAASSVDSVALSFFFIPTWRRMEYHKADWYAKAAELSLERLALRQLWARSFSRVYDETGTGMMFVGQKLEYI